MIYKTIKSHTIQLCAFVLLASVSGFTIATEHTISNSNFTFLDPGGFFIDEATDVFGTFDDSMLCDSESCTLSGSMTLASNTPFFGQIWIAHDIRVFTEGT